DPARTVDELIPEIRPLRECPLDRPWSAILREKSLDGRLDGGEITARDDSCPGEQGRRGRAELPPQTTHDDVTRDHLERLLLGGSKDQSAGFDIDVHSVL